MLYSYFLVYLIITLTAIPKHSLRSTSALGTTALDVRIQNTSGSLGSPSIPKRKATGEVLIQMPRRTETHLQDDQREE
ncbi:hypothetical protein KSX_00190 [Ktedonospora formicarum]|uniref:Uncharacterized protein n=1 Tax=Ktedonospora formicarum TaxID=2778364 RepID=A0A8J3HR91_9CHLR|nr:hypothetical protein KSX_00190 [Ktedonospora formicarum]